MGNPKRARQKNVRLGLRIGLGMATVYSVWVSIIRLALGPHAFDRFGLSWWQLVAIYYGGLALGGWVYGLAEPFRRYLWGAVLQGLALMLPLYGGLATAMGLSLRQGSEFRTYMILGLILAIVGGGALGFSWWTDEHDVAEDPADAERR